MGRLIISLESMWIPMSIPIHAHVAVAAVLLVTQVTVLLLKLQFQNE